MTLAVNCMANPKRVGSSTQSSPHKNMEAAISRQGRFIFFFLVLLISDHVSAQDGEELLTEFSAAERASIRSACYGASLSGPARFYACLTQKANDLRRSPGEPTLKEFSGAEQASIRSACYGAGLSGPARFYACLTQKADDLRRSPREPSLSGFSVAEQNSMRSACYGAGLSGPASFYACLRRKVNDLETSAGEPSLSRFFVAEQSAMRSACYGAGLSGPASFYACLRRKAYDLERSPGEPSLADFSVAEQNLMRSACYGAGLSGPASLYTCLRQKASDLRRSPGEPSLDEFLPAEQSSMRSACYGASLSGPASLYACLRQKTAELRRVRRQFEPPSREVWPNASQTTTSPASSDVAAAQSAPAPATTPVSAPAPSEPDVDDQAVSQSVESTIAPKRAQATRPSRTSGGRSNRITSIVATPSESAARIAAPPTTPSPPSRSTATRPPDDFGLVVAFWLAVGSLVWGVRHLRRRAHAAAPTPPDANGAAPIPPDPRERSTPGRADARDVGITFTDPRTDAAWTPHGADLTGVRDALTGQPLRPAPGLHRCTRCHVFYQASSVDFIQRENGGCCAGCGSVSVFPVNPSHGSEQRPSDRPEITTLANYRSRVGEVVIFEGRCVRVLPSRSGTAFAVMFENGGWTEGFKLVIRTEFVARVGGADYIRSLAGRTIRVRGLITHSPAFGYEMTVTTHAMMLDVWS
jgi:hypothetical protein